MSATGRGAKRHADDFYATPGWTTRSILPILAKNLSYIKSPKILEPGAGEGAIVTECRAYWPKSIIHAVEIDKDRCDAIKNADVTCCDDYLDPNIIISRDYDLIITNPPFKLALPFIEQSLKRAKLVCMLLRINFLGSQRRYQFWKENPCGVFVLPKRPSFTGGSTDATEYAWFVWGFGLNNYWDVLEFLP